MKEKRKKREKGGVSAHIIWIRVLKDVIMPSHVHASAKETKVINC